MIVGVEANRSSTWFVELIEGLGHRVFIGDASEIRRLAKRRLKNDRRDAEHILSLLGGKFPQIHRPSLESREVLRLLGYRHKLVQMCTRARNSPQALAFSAGSSGRSKLLNREGRARFLQLPILESVTRFAGGRKVAAYVGLEPMEYSSGDKQQFGSISKSSSRLLRYLLVEAAQITLRSNEGLERFYLRLLRRRGAQKAKVAVALKLLIRGYILLRDGIDYAELLGRGVETRPARLAT